MSGRHTRMPSAATQHTGRHGTCHTNLMPAPVSCSDRRPPCLLTLSMCGNKNNKPECIPVPSPIDDSTPRLIHQVVYSTHSCSASSSSKNREQRCSASQQKGTHLKE